MAGRGKECERALPCPPPPFPPAPSVIPAKAGIQRPPHQIPAFAGMTSLDAGMTSLDAGMTGPYE